MIDWHSHILPAMDDGSKDVEESLLLLEKLRQQGVTTVVATPHFYADDESVDHFLKRRIESLRLLEDSVISDGLEIVLGAEVRYYAGIGKLSQLSELRIGESGILLLEMPFSRWTEYMLRELTELSVSGGVTVALAHIDRYLQFQDDEVWARLRNFGILMQVNANAFVKFGSRHRVISLMKKGFVNFIGSDCHNMSARPPHIGAAFDVIRKKFGNDFVYQFNEYGYSMLVK